MCAVSKRTNKPNSDQDVAPLDDAVASDAPAERAADDEASPSRLSRVLALAHDQVDARALAVFRIGLAIAVWFEARENTGRLSQYTPGQYHVPYLGLEIDASVQQLLAVCEWQMRFAVFLALGLFSKVFAVAALVCQASLFLVSQLNFRNHIYLMLVLLALVAFSQSDKAWSVRHLVAKLRGETDYDARRAEGLGPRMIQAQVLIIYFYSGLHKLLLGFGGGYALCRFLGRELPRGRSGEWLAGSERWLTWVNESMSREACVEGAPAVIVAGSLGTIVAELVLAFALVYRPTRYLAAVVGIGLHAVIFWSMDVVTFGLMMVASYPLFLASPWWPRPPAVTAETAKPRSGT